MKLINIMFNCNVIFRYLIYLVMFIVANKSYSQRFDGIGSDTSYSIVGLNPTSGYYFNKHDDSGFIYNHHVYVNTGDSLVLDYLCTSNSQVRFFVVYSPTGPKDTFRLNNMAPNTRNFIKSYNITSTAEEGIWIIKPFKSGTIDIDSTHKFKVKVYDSLRNIRKGRTYLYQLSLKAISTNSFNFSMYTINPYGYKYRNTYYELQPINGVLFASPYGLYHKKNECATLNYSITFQMSDTILMPYTCSGYRKVFLNRIDSTMPETAPIYNLVTNTTTTDWLNPNIKAPKPISLKYIPSADDYRVGNFLYQIDSFDGNVLIRIDVNNNGIYTDAVDYQYYKKVESGINYLPFNGKDNLGNELSFVDPVNIIFEIDRLGENHIILSDVEGLGGVTVERLTGANLPDYTINWNDSALLKRTTTGQLTGDKKVAAKLVNSNVTNGVHGWIYNGNNTTGWGNYSYIDNYSYLPVDTLILKDTLRYKLDKGNLSNTWPKATIIFEEKNGSYDTAVWLGGSTGKPKVHNDANLDKNDGVVILQSAVKRGIGTEGKPFVIPHDSLIDIKISMTANNSASKVKYGVWIDVNKNGSFTDAIDVFITDSTALSTTTRVVSHATVLPVLDPVAIQEMVMRVVVTKSNAVLTKSMNGNVNFINGEIEDYYITSYPIDEMPLSILDFAINKVDDDKVSYEVNTASNSSYESMELLYSKDLKDWKVLTYNDQLIKENGQHKFKGIAKHPIISDKYYYKVQLKNKESKLVNTGIKQLYFDIYNEISVYPNPANDVITISSQKYSIKGIMLYNIHGQNITDQVKRLSSDSYDISLLSSGYYYISIINEIDQLTSIKFIKK